MKTLKKLSVLLILVSFQFFAQNNESKSASVNSFIDQNTPANAKPLGISGNWTLDFSDEFDTTDINLLKWNKPKHLFKWRKN